jgi:hypothetical protein
MLDVKSIAEQVKHNCNISDARFWGFYSPCGLLLRLRNLYKLEHGITLWEKVSQVKIADWIAYRMPGSGDFTRRAASFSD